MVPRGEIRLYRVIRGGDQSNQQKTRKTYWEKYWELKCVRDISKARSTVFIFFCYMFMFSTAEYTGTMQLGFRCVVAQIIITSFTVLSAMCLDHGVQQLKLAFMIPFMSVVMGALSCYICLFAGIIFTFASIPAYDYVLLAFHIFLFVVTSIVTFSLAKATDILWQAFFTLVDLSASEGVLEKLRSNAPVEEKDDVKRKKKKNGETRFILAARRILR
ncbi:unnamed protein product [Caenorhabditis sp. 36 PRJEB53466]|nr:unnamed protein product [Caenorhabditis sp. 36 PRJEB53466]